MSYQPLDFGTSARNDGEKLFTGFSKIDAMLAELYTSVSADAAALAAHIADSSDAHNSSAIGFTQAGTGAVERTALAKMRDWVSILDFANVDSTGATSSTAGFTAADAAVSTGTIIYVPQGTYNLASAPTLTRASWLVSPGASFTGSGAATIHATMGRGFYTDKGNGVNVWRFNDRMFIGAATDNDGSTTGTGSDTYIQDAGVGYYYERGAQFAALSVNAGIGGLFGSRSSDKYTYHYPTATVWQGSTAVSLNDYLGFAGRIYQVTTGGTTHATVGPSHTTGSAANGTATLLFVDFAYVAPIGSASVIINDLVNDSTGAWGRLTTAARMSANAGTTYGEEMDVANFGNDVVNHPYSITPAGTTVGYWIAAGYDANINPSINPSTCAILIGSNDNDFNKGIVFQNGSLVGPAIAMAEAQEVAWYVSGGTKRGTLTYNSSGYLALSGAVTGYSFDNELLATKAGNTARFVNSSDSASVQVARFEGDRATMADNDSAYFSLMLSNDAGTQSEFARITWLGTDVNAGTNIDGALVFGVVTAGVFANKLSLDGTGLNPNASGGLSLGKSGVLWNGGWWSASSVQTWGAADYTVTHSTGDLAFSGSITLPNTGLHLLDTNGSHDLIITPGSNVTADRTVSLNTGDMNSQIITNTATAILAAGYSVTPYDLGTATTGTVTPNEANGNVQKYINGGAHTLAPPTNECQICIQMTNNGSAGAITTSGFTKLSGDALTTTNGDDFLLWITKVNGFSRLYVEALQ